MEENKNINNIFIMKPTWKASFQISRRVSKLKWKENKVLCLELISGTKESNSVAGILVRIDPLYVIRMEVFQECYTSTQSETFPVRRWFNPFWMLMMKLHSTKPVFITQFSGSNIKQMFI